MMGFLPKNRCNRALPVTFRLEYACTIVQNVPLHKLLRERRGFCPSGAAMMVEVYQRVCHPPPAYSSKFAWSSLHSSLSFSMSSWRFNYLLNQKKRVVRDERVAENFGDGANQDSAKFNSDWDSLVDSHLKSEKADPLYSVENFDTSDFRPFGIVLASLIMIFFLASSGVGEDLGALFGLIFFCGVPLYFLGSFVFMVMKYRGPFLVGFSIPLAIIIPISIMSYYNEIENGCIFFGFPGESRCPPDPPGYRTPTTLFFMSNLGLLIYGSIQYGTNPVRTLGMAYGVIAGVMIFFIATISGLWGF